MQEQNKRSNVKWKELYESMGMDINDRTRSNIMSDQDKNGNDEAGLKKIPGLPNKRILR